MRVHFGFREMHPLYARRRIRYNSGLLDWTAVMDFSALNWSVLALAALLIGVSKTGMPGVGILAIAMAGIVLPTKTSTGFILPMLIVGDVFAVSYYHRHAVWKHLVRMLPYAVVGVIAGFFILRVVTEQQLKPILGGVILALLGLSYLSNRNGAIASRLPEGWWFSAGMGLLAGATTMMANAAGPIMIVYLLAMRLPKDAFIGTGAWYFLLVNCFKVPFSAGLGLITPASLKFNLILAPAIVIGAILGILLAKRIPEKAFTIIVQILTVAAAVKLLFW
jgi:uncharacterized protein